MKLSSKMVPNGEIPENRIGGLDNLANESVSETNNNFRCGSLQWIQTEFVELAMDKGFEHYSH